MKIHVTDYIPVKIRDAFIPSPGYIWISADYSQLEYRVMANMAMAKGLIDSFAKGVDFHTATASLMLNIPVDKVDKKARKIGKTLNFGISYGMSAWGLADRLGISQEEAQAQMDLYFQNIPEIKELTEKVKKETKARGYSTTYLGRIRHFKKQLQACNGSFNKEDRVLKQAFNTTIQGSAADFAKIALARLNEAIKPYGDKIRIVSQIHDEFNFEVHKSLDLTEVCRVIDRAGSFRGVIPGWADIPLDIEMGENFGDLKDPREFGVDMDSILKDPEPTDIDRDFFKQIFNKDTISSYSNVSEKNHVNNINLETKTKEKSAQFRTRDTIKVEASKVKPSVTVKEVSKELSAGQKMKQQLEEQREKKKMDRIDLSNAKFKQSTVVLYKKPDADDDTAFNLLKKFVAEHFGQNDLVMEHEGMLYKFPDQYRISDDFKDLEHVFEIQYFKVAPKISLSI